MRFHDTSNPSTSNPYKCRASMTAYPNSAKYPNSANQPLYISMTISDPSSKYFWTREMPIQCNTTPITRFTATCKVLIFSHAAREGDSPLQPACYTCTHWQHCFVTSTFNSPRRSILLPCMYMGRRTFTVFRLMFNAPEWPFRTALALESPILMG